GRRDDDEDREDLAGQIGQKAREGDEIEVRGVEHQLDRHQQDDAVAAGENTDDADEEESEAEVEHVLDRDDDHSCFLASTTAPIIAISRRTEATSKGRRYRV